MMDNEVKNKGWRRCEGIGDGEKEQEMNGKGTDVRGTQKQMKTSNI
jgi:hypothetical protein